MPLTMTRREEALRRKHWTGWEVDTLWTELDAERDAHDATRAELARANERLKLAEAVCVAYDELGHSAQSLRAVQAWRAAR